jgi:O-antigen/teichoic acid export membrane protein
MTTQAGDDAKPPFAAEDFDLLAREATLRSSGLAFDKALGYVYFLLVTKTYGSYDFSIYLAGVAAVEIALAVVEMGLGPASIRAVARHSALGAPGETRGIIRAAAAIVLPLGMAAAGALFLLADTFAWSLGRPDAAQFLRIVALTIPLSLAADAIFWATEGFGLQRYLTIVRMVVEPVVKIAVTIAFFEAFGESATAVDLGIAYVIATASSALLAIVVWHIVVRPRTAGAVAASHFRPLLTDGVPMWGNALLARVFAKADVILLFAFAPATTAALYAMAFNTALLPSMIATAFDAAFRPSVARALALERLGEAATLFRRLSRVVLTMCLPAAIVLVLFPERVMAVVGDQFVPVASVVPLVAIGTLVSYLLGPTSTLLAMSGRARLPLVNNLAAGFLTLALEIALIPRFGATGAASAQCVGMIAGAVLNARAAWRSLGVWSLTREHGTPLVAALAASAAGLVASSLAPSNKYLGLAVVGGATCAAYAATLWAMGISDDDKRTIWSLVARFVPIQRA